MRSSSLEGETMQWQIDAILLDEDGRETVWNCSHVATSDAVDVDALNRLLDDAEEVWVTSELVVLPPWGSPKMPSYGERFYFAPDIWLEMHRDNLKLRYRGQETIVGHGRTLTHKALRQNDAGQALTPRDYGVDAVAYDKAAGARGELRFEVPSLFVALPGGDRPLTIRNPNPLQDYEVKGWGDENIATLKYNESLPVLVTRGHDGSGFMANNGPFARRHSIHGEGSGDFSQVGYFAVGAGRRARPIPVPRPSSGNYRFESHSEAFRSGAASFVNGAELTASNLAVEGSIVLPKPGATRYVLVVVVRTAPTVGWIPADSAPTLYLQRGGDVRVVDDRPRRGWARSGR